MEQNSFMGLATGMERPAEESPFFHSSDRCIYENNHIVRSSNIYAPDCDSFVGRVSGNICMWGRFVSLSSLQRRR